MNSPAINISRFNGNNTIVVHSTDISVDGLSPINTGSVVTVHVDTFDQWPVGTIDSFPNNLSSVINDAIPLNYSRIISEYTRSSNSEELLSSFSVHPNLESLQPRILEAFLAAKRGRELRSNNPNLSVNDVQNNMDFSNNLTNVINNVNENRFVEWLQSSLDNPLSSVFTHIFQTWGIDSLAWITDMIHVPGCTSVLLFVTLNHTLSQIWVLLLRGMRWFRLSLLDLVLFYKRLLKKSLQYLHALRTNRLVMVYQNTSEDNITQQPRVPGETQLAITESVNTRIGVVEGLAKIDEENAKIAAAEVLLKKSFFGRIRLRMGTHLSWLGSIYTVPASTLAKMKLSAADLIADGSFILISAGIMNLLCVTFTGYNSVQNLIQRFWVASPSIMRKTIDGTVYLIKKVTKDIK